jgi:hypothetical protein
MSIGRVVDGFSKRRTWFNFKAVHVQFIADTVALRHIISKCFSFSRQLLFNQCYVHSSVAWGLSNGTTYGVSVQEAQWTPFQTY